MYLFARSKGAISYIKMIIGFMICILTMLTGVADKSEPNVALDITSEITTQSTEINFVLENKGNTSIKRTVYLKSFEKKVDGQWLEIQFNDDINYSPAIYYDDLNKRYFFPKETIECKFKINWLSTDDEAITTLDAGEYRVTFGYSSGILKIQGNSDFKNCSASCEFEVKAA